MTTGPAAAAVAERPLATRALTRCLACSAQELQPLPLRYEFRGSFPLVECQVCGMRFLAIQPAGEALAELYSPEYFDRDFRCGRVAASAFEEEPFREESAGLLADFERLRPQRGVLLEIGSAAGWLLRHAQERGWRVQGVELSAEAAAYARQLGVPVHHGDLGSARLPDAAFDLAYMGDVLEHVPDCRATLAEVVRVLRPGGLFYLRGPITTNSLGRRLGLAVYGATHRTIVLREPPYHLWEFRPGSLRRLFERVGLEVTRLRQSKIAPGQAHGSKSGWERAILGALDAINLPITNALNVAGDRIVMVGRKPGG